MSASPRSGYDKRISSLVVVVAIVIGALVIDVSSAMTWRDQASSLSDLKAHTRMLEERAASVAAMAEPGAAPMDARLLINGETSGLVSAELQRIISDIAQRSGAAVRSLDVPENEPVGDIVDATGKKLVRVRLNASIEVMEPALPDLLYAIETNLPMLVVDAVTLRPNRRIEASAGDEPIAAPIDRPLALSLTISAFHLQVPE